jgi:hypothetical protein
MARTNIAAQTLPLWTGGAYPTLPISGGDADITFVAADVSLGNSSALLNNKTMVLAYNTAASAAHTITFTSAVDAQNRTGDITAYSIAAGKVAAFGPFKSDGWAIGGLLEIDCNHAEITLAIITLP